MKKIFLVFSLILFLANSVNAVELKPLELPKNDLKNEKKEAALNFWYNDYKLKTGYYALSFEDFLNMGHLTLAQGQIQDAINYYKKSINYNKSDIEKLLYSLKEDEKHLFEMGINVSMIPYIIDALLYSID